MDVAPAVLGSGKRYFGSVDSQHLLEDPDVVIGGNQVLPLRYPVRRRPIRADGRGLARPRAGSGALDLDLPIGASQQPLVLLAAIGAPR